MRIIEARDNKTQFNVAIVVSRFNPEITERLLKSALERLKELEFPDNQITVARVPGCVEIPLTAQRLAQMGIYEAVLALGAVVSGETDHYAYVCEQVSHGCQRVALQNDIPVIFGVLTTRDERQALERSGGKEGNKGREAVDTAVEIVTVLRQIG